jgi:hypothetical protein
MALLLGEKGAMVLHRAAADDNEELISVILKHGAQVSESHTYDAIAMCHFPSCY